MVKHIDNPEIQIEYLEKIIKNIENHKSPSEKSPSIIPKKPYDLTSILNKGKHIKLQASTIESIKTEIETIKEELQKLKKKKTETRF